MRSVAVALAAGAILIGGALAVTLTRAPPRVAHVNFTAVRHETPSFFVAQGPFAFCQEGELLPRGTTAVRASLGASLGPKVDVVAFAGSHPIARGSTGSGWQVTGITVPLRPVPTRSEYVTLCFSWALASSESVSLNGEEAAPRLAALLPDGRALPGRIQVEDLQSGHSSWLALALTLARHMGLGRAAGGSWIALLAAALMAAVTLLCAGLTLRELR